MRGDHAVGTSALASQRGARVGRLAGLYTEYLAILNWLGEFDVMEDFAERAHDYRAGIGVDHFPENGETYLRALVALARETAGA